MKTLPVAALACGIALSACAPLATQTTETVAKFGPNNPFYAISTLPYAVPPFDRIRDEHYLPAFEAGMEQELREVLAIAAATEPPSFANTIEAMERSGLLLERVSTVFFNLASAHTNPQIQALQQSLAPRLAAHNDTIYLNAALYARVAQLYERREGLGLDAESLRLLERYHRNFVRAGARLSDDDKMRLRAFNEELSSLTTRFQQNLLKDTNDTALVLDRAEELAGLSADAVAAAAAAAQARGLEGKWLLALQLPTGQPALTHLKDRDVRRRLFEASIERANHGNEYDNKDVLARIAQLRAERAGLLGYATHAAYQIEDQTAQTPEAVAKLLRQITPPAVANARAEAKELQKLINAEVKRGDSELFMLEPWDWAYYSEQLRKARYDFDEAALKPYFELERVLKDGVFYFAGQLYGLQFKERKDLPTYQADVRVFEVFESDGTPLGLFYADFYTRPSKRGGAWANSLVRPSGLLGGRPVVVNNLNVPKPPDGQPTLLTMDEVNTMFHEFGHALHALFSDVRYPSFAGTAVPRDFVEYPSQVHEMWALEPTVLANYARHYQTGEPMPQALVDKVKAAETFNQGFATTEYLAATWLDQAWHMLSGGEPLQDPRRFEPEALREAGADFAAVPPRYRSTYFAHVFAGGYSAGYYSYIWSEVLDADTVQWFRENGGLKRENGDHFRRTLLARGGSREAMDLYRDFRGRDARIEPLLERRGLKPVRAKPAQTPRKPAR
ncbi:MAG TPA: M3 family metallopeptidase [Solimonas sp.]